MSETFPPVDWAKPIEAVNLKDGQVLSVSVASGPYGDRGWYDITPWLGAYTGHFMATARISRLRGASATSPPNLKTIAEDAAKDIPKLVQDWLDNPDAPAGYVGLVKFAFRRAGIIEPTEAERISETTGHPIAVVQSVLDAREQEK